MCQSDALHLEVLHLEVGDRGLQLRVPVHQPPVAIDQPFPVQRRRTPSRTAADSPSSMVNRSRGQSSDAPSRRSCWVIVPPDSAFHCQTRSTNLSRPSVAPVRPLLGQQPLHHHLRGDPGVVGARLPQHVAPLHAPPADQRVLHGEGQRMAHVQAAGDVRRRDHDGVGRRVGVRIAGERPCPLPALIQARLDLRGVVGLVQHLALLRPHADAAGGRR